MKRFNYIFLIIVIFTLASCSTLASNRDLYRIVPDSTLYSKIRGPLYFSPGGRIISPYHGSGRYNIYSGILTIMWPSEFTPSGEHYYKFHLIDKDKLLSCWEDNIDKCDKSDIWKFEKGNIYKIQSK